MRLKASQPRLCACAAPQCRAAFTLLEVLLVLAIVAVIATLSWPQLLMQFRQQSLNSNAEQVRQLLDRARVMAVEQGEILQVRTEPNGTKYLIMPRDVVDDSATSQTDAEAGITTTFKKSTSKRDPFRIYTLGDNCRFHVDSSLISGEQVQIESLDLEALSAVENPADGKDVGWSPPILYYPDGSSSGGSIIVMDQSNRYIKLHVRDLTGGVFAQAPQTMAERLGATGN